MDIPIKPIYLLADSQLLFWKENNDLFLDSVRNHIASGSPKAAYVGASNGDKPEFYSIFSAAMEAAGINDCRMIRSLLTDDDAAFLDQADIILLAGGDVEMGWNVFKATGINDIIVKKYYEGAVLMGVSAGAVQLGLGGWPEDRFSSSSFIDTFRLLPLIISAHDEAQEWESLKKAVQFMGEHGRGIGIPSGGGMIYHTDHTVEPVRHPLYEFSVIEDRLVHSMLFPGSAESDTADTDIVER